LIWGNKESHSALLNNDKESRFAFLAEKQEAKKSGIKSKSRKEAGKRMFV